MCAIYVLCGIWHTHTTHMRPAKASMCACIQGDAAGMPSCKSIQRIMNHTFYTIVLKKRDSCTCTQRVGLCTLSYFSRSIKPFETITTFLHAVKCTQQCTDHVRTIFQSVRGSRHQYTSCEYDCSHREHTKQRGPHHR